MDEEESFRHFDLLDYSLFGFLLAASALIGVYFAFCAKQKQNTTSEYLMGGKTMGIFPISMSLIASYISGISLIGIPSEMYVYGTQYWVITVSEVFTSVTMAVVFLPVFFTLQITSSYEYLRLRFNTAVRTLGSGLFLMKMMLYIPIVIYAPALSFSQVTGFSLHVLIPLVCFVCIFYTTLGGLKAVVWTDTLQTILMLIGIMTVLTLGTYDVGGLATVWGRSSAGDRLEFFNFDVDPTVRHTFWTVAFGKFFQHLASNTVNQAMVQRCLAMPTLAKARITLVIFTVGIIGLVSMCCYTGLVMYAAFYNCDPITTRHISKADQLLPYFVMKFTSHVPGLPGIFLSGVFSAALSSMSTGLNSMTGVLLEDFIRPFYKKPLSEARASFIMKVIVVLLGAAFVGLAFLVDKLGGLIQMAGSMSGITAGTLLGLFSLGMLFPWANSTGALVGGVTSFFFVGWLSFGTQVAIARNQITYPVKPVSVEGCTNTTFTWLNTTQTPVLEPTEAPFPMYTISYVYYTFIGTSVVIVVGLVVSFLTGPQDPLKVDPNLYSPTIHGLLQRAREQSSSKVSSVPPQFEFDWPKELQAQIISAPFYGMLMSQFVACIASNIVKNRTLLLAEIAVVTVLSAAIPSAARVHPQLVFTVKLVEGFFLGLVMPAVLRVLSRWAMVKEKTLLTGLVMAGVPISNFTVFPTAGLVCETFGWSALFYFKVGWLIVTFIVAWFLLYDGPDFHIRISDREKELILSQVPPVMIKMSIPWKAIARSAPVYALLLTHFCHMWVYMGLLLGLPQYMRDVHHFNLTKNGGLSSMPYIGMLLLRLSISWFYEDFRQKCGMSNNTCRKMLLSIGALGASASNLGISLLPSGLTELSLALIILVVLFSELALTGGYFNCVMTMAPTLPHVMVSLIGFPGSITGILTPLCVGFLTKDASRESWDILFYISCGVNLVEFITFFSLGSADVQPWGKFDTHRTVEETQDEDEKRNNEGVENEGILEQRQAKA